MSCLLVEMPAVAVVPASRIDETKTSSMSLIVTVVTHCYCSDWFRLNLFITIFLLFFKVVQNVYVSWKFFLGIVSISEYQSRGVPRRGW